MVVAGKSRDEKVGKSSAGGDRRILDEDRYQFIDGADLTTYFHLGFLMQDITGENPAVTNTVHPHRVAEAAYFASRSSSRLEYIFS